MQIYKTQEEVDNDLNEFGDLILDCSVRFDFSVRIKRNITAGDITAGNIDAGDITALDIDAGNIDAGNISFFAFCIAYSSIKCKSWIARRENHITPQCIDGELIVGGAK